MVFLVHYSQMFSRMNWYAHNLLKYGQTGCQLFMVVSGYLMAQSFEEGKMNTWGTYFKKRYIGLLSGFLIAIVFYCLLSHVITLCAVNAPFVSDCQIISILINVLLLHGVVPFCNNTVVPGGWYIGTVVIAYAIIPLILRKVKGYKKLLLSATIVSLVSFVIAILLQSMFSVNCGNNTFFFYSIISQASPILIGCSMYYFEKEKNSISIVKSIIIFMVFSIVSLFIFITDIDLLATLIPFTVSLSFVGLFYIVKYCVKKMKNVKNLFVIIGQNSLGCYLFHFIFVWYIPFYIRRFCFFSDNVLFVFLFIPCLFLASVVGISMNKLILKFSSFLLQFTDRLKISKS